LDFAFSLKNTVSLQVLLNLLGDFDETWYKERSDCLHVHIVRGAVSNYILTKGVMTPGLNFSFEKYFVYATSPKPFVQDALGSILQREMLFPTV
jgi:hypothetical protein